MKSNFIAFQIRFILGAIALFACNAYSQSSSLEEQRIGERSETLRSKSLVVWESGDLLRRIRDGKLNGFENQTRSVHFDYHTPKPDEVRALRAIGRFDELWIGDDGSLPMQIHPDLPNAISELTELRVLHLLVSNPEHADWTPIEKMINLEELRINSNEKLNQVTLNSIGRLNRLLYLTLSAKLDAVDYSWLKGMTRLEELDIVLSDAPSEGSETFYCQLKHLTLLKSLSLRGSSVSQCEIDVLANGIGVHLSSLNCTLAEVCDVVAFRDTLGKLTALETLGIRTNPGTEIDLDLLLVLPNLRSLAVFGEARKIKYSTAIFSQHLSLNQVTVFDTAENSRPFFEWNRFSD